MRPPSKFLISETDSDWIVASKIEVTTELAQVEVYATISKKVPNGNGYAAYILKEMQDTEY